MIGRKLVEIRPTYTPPIHYNVKPAMRAGGSIDTRTAVVGEYALPAAGFQKSNQPIKSARITIGNLL
jgi:hypothetical protein